MVREGGGMSTDIWASACCHSAEHSCHFDLSSFTDQCDVWCWSHGC